MTKRYRNEPVIDPTDYQVVFVIAGAHGSEVGFFDDYDPDTGRAWVLFGAEGVPLDQTGAGVQLRWLVPASPDMAQRWIRKYGEPDRMKARALDIPWQGDEAPTSH